MKRKTRCTLSFTQLKILFLSLIVLSILLHPNRLSWRVPFSILAERMDHVTSCDGLSKVILVVAAVLYRERSSPDTVLHKCPDGKSYLVMCCHWCQ